jgi:type II secretory pathway pseudopilin PulG
MRRAGRESGFALLLVFLMAAAVALSLYVEIPRVAMQSQRAKEQLLIDRGEQYKRAIQLFVRASGRYPGSIQELESFNNRRFLRRRYKDPMTGKDEWRIVHIGPGGVLTDSALNKTGDKDKNASAANTNKFITELPTAGSAAQTATGAANLAMRRRTNEGGMGTAPGIAVGPDGTPLPMQPGQPGAMGGYGGFAPLPGAPGQMVAPQTPGPASASALPAWARAQMGILTFPGSPAPGQRSSAAPAAPSYVGGGTYVGTIGGGPPSATPPLPPYPGAPVSSQTGGVSPMPYSTMPGAQGPSALIQQPGTQTGMAPPNNEALNMIQRLLTTPRPGGMPQSGMSGAGGMQIVAGSIAGVATTVEEEGVMVYNDRSKYNEWEFIYDFAKEKKLPNPNAGVIGTSADQMNPGSGAGPQPTSPFGPRPSGLGAPR